MHQHCQCWLGWEIAPKLNLAHFVWRQQFEEICCWRYDCDFNQQLELGLGGGLSVFDVESLEDPKLQRAAGGSATAVISSGIPCNRGDPDRGSLLRLHSSSGLQLTGRAALSAR